MKMLWNASLMFGWIALQYRTVSTQTHVITPCFCTKRLFTFPNESKENSACHNHYHLVFSWLWLRLNFVLLFICFLPANKMERICGLVVSTFAAQIYTKSM